MIKNNLTLEYCLLQNLIDDFETLKSMVWVTALKELTP